MQESSRQTQRKIATGVNFYTLLSKRCTTVCLTLLASGLSTQPFCLAASNDVELSIAAEASSTPAAESGLRVRRDAKVLAPLPPPSPLSDPPVADPRNIEGVWLGKVTADSLTTESPPPYTAKAAEMQRYKLAMLAKGTPLGGLEARCRPIGAMRLGADLFPAEIIQAPDKIVVLNEEGRTRWQIFMHRDHPRYLRPSYWGDSVGHWEQDTLVVDTIGFNGLQEYLSTRAHVVTRIRKIDGGRGLRMEMTTEDPENFTRPFVQTAEAIWHPDLQLFEYQCEENLTGAREGLLLE